MTFKDRLERAAKDMEKCAAEARKIAAANEGSKQSQFEASAGEFDSAASIIRQLDCIKLDPADQG